MKIEQKKITVRELTAGYKDGAECGTIGYSSRLDIRPIYQREFVYKDVQRNAVIATISDDFPLGIMYWSVREDGNFDIIDGQQRTVSICQFVKGEFSLALFSSKELRYFHNLQYDEREKILNYEITVYLCSGTDGERLNWFRTVNIASVKLTEQELRNAVYAGPWTVDAKRYFSKRQCAACKIGSGYLRGDPNRQEYLETAIKWCSNGDIEGYMAKQQHNPNANELWLYFQSVINWVEVTFPRYRKEMKGLAWGELYNKHKGELLDSSELEKKVAQLLLDDEVTDKNGIYSFVLNHEEKHLNIRSFSDSQKREAYEKQQGFCPMCTEQKHWDIDDMEADHITPWHKGGKTTADNCRVLCTEHNRRKSGK